MHWDLTVDTFLLISTVILCFADFLVCGHGSMIWQLSTQHCKCTVVCWQLEVLISLVGSKSIKFWCAHNSQIWTKFGPSGAICFSIHPSHFPLCTKMTQVGPNSNNLMANGLIFEVFCFWTYFEHRFVVSTQFFEIFFFVLLCNLRTHS